MSAPPDGLPLYRVVTGPDDAAFCRRVSDAIALGYRLHEGPAVTFNGEQVIVAQALLWREPATCPRASLSARPGDFATAAGGLASAEVDGDITIYGWSPIGQGHDRSVSAIRDSRSVRLSTVMGWAPVDSRSHQ